MRVLYETLFCLLTTSSCLKPELKIGFALSAKKQKNKKQSLQGNYFTIGQNSGQQLVQHTQQPFWKPVLNDKVINLSQLLEPSTVLLLVFMTPDHP